MEFCEESPEIKMLECWRFIGSWSSSAGVGLERKVLEFAGCWKVKKQAGVNPFGRKEDILF